MLVSDLEVLKLENGLTLYLKPMDDHNKLSCRLVVGAGYQYEEVHKMGVAHCLEHLLADYTKDEKVEFFEQIVERSGILNAYTLHDRTVFHVDMQADQITGWFQMMEMTFSDPPLTMSKLEIEREIILSEFFTRESEFQWAELQREVLGPYAFSETGFGDPDSISRISIDDITTFFRQYYFRENMALVCVGSFNRSEVIKLASNWLFKLPQKGIVNRPAKWTGPDLTKVVVPYHDKEDGVFFGYRLPIGKEEIGKRVALGLIEEHLGDKIFKKIRAQGLGYTYSVMTHVYDDVLLFSIMVDHLRKDKDALAEYIHECIEKLRNQGVSSQRLDKLKTRRINHFADECSYSISMADHLLNYLPITSIGSGISCVRSEITAVSQETLKKVANKYLDGQYLYQAWSPGFLDKLKGLVLLIVLIFFIYGALVLFGKFSNVITVKYSKLITNIFIIVIGMLLVDKFFVKK